MVEKKSTGRKPGHNASSHGFVESPTAHPTPPTPQKVIIRSSGVVPIIHPALAGKALDTLPRPIRLANLSEAKKEYELAKSTLALTRARYGVDSVSPGYCANCQHPHHLEKPLPLTLGNYISSKSCNELVERIYPGGSKACGCVQSETANEGQVAMYKAEQEVEENLEAIHTAQKEVDETQPSDSYFVIKGLRSRNKFGSVILTKSEGKRTKVLLAIRDKDGKITGQQWFPLRKLKRSLVHLGLLD